MSTYFPNAYLADLRNSAGDPYNGQTNGGDPCEQRHYIQPPYSSSPVQGATYPRFPPYDRLEIRPITSGPNSPSPPGGGGGYYPNHCGQPRQMQQGPPPPPTHAPLSHPNAYVPQDAGQNCRGSPPEQDPMSPTHYSSCKMHPAAPMHHEMPPTPRHGDCPNGGPPPLQQAPPCHSPVHSPPHQMYQPPNHGPPPNHPQPPTHPPPNSGPPPGANLQSPLYPWMRSQFGKCVRDTILKYIYVCVRAQRH
ncbi:HOXB7 [Cordylochernes scorpioides]|uniref:HOXB7 n=1 Tax=Cordylochernes scorpioides TaxID=51811 RepID=A0ABY6LRS0_9ARAC|nr:HOXB7 [Cordylochernes scorpioides]